MMMKAMRLLTVLVTAFAIGAPAVYAGSDMAAATRSHPGTWSMTDRLNVNTASVEQLAKVPGLNETTAKAIVAYRQANGPFQNLNQLQYVDGIQQMDLSSLDQYLLAD